ncbi:MAG: VanW family protein [Clostridia bacterium]|nr:VanW family protein [Clostridia bacterium]
MKKSICAAVLLLLLLIACACPAEEAENETALYYGYIGKKMDVHRWGDNDSSVLGVIEAGRTVDVYNKGRTWTRIDFDGQQGYVLTKYVERVQRKDPFQGPMPGTSKHVAVGYVLRDTSFKPEGYRYPIEVSEGSWLSIERIQDDRAYFPYRREPDDVSVKTENLRIYDFVPWDQAQPGDLLYAFTTFFTTSLNKEGNAGRLHNIALAAQRLTSIRVKPGDTFSFNAVCGPYTKENGYRSAPILSGESEMGYGGGVCQVCSTFYNIVLRVPMVIEEMNWHSQGGGSYLPAGFDATVGTNSDLVVRNILPYDLRIELETLDGVMTAFLFRDYED